MENGKWKIIGAARAEISPHPGLDPLIPGLTRDLLRIITDEIAGQARNEGGNR